MPGPNSIRSPRRGFRCLAALIAVLLATVSTSVHASEPEPDSPLVVVAPPPPPPLRASAPESGTGLITLGSMLIVGGVAMVAGSSYAVSQGHKDFALGIVGGTVFAAGGSVFIWLGTRRVRKLRAWSEDTQLRVPPSGAGLLISGLAVAGGGAISLMAVGAMSIAYCEGDCFPQNPDVWFGAGASAIVLGASMAVTGGVLRHRHKQWRAGGSTTRLQILPMVAPSLGGVRLGVVGRF